MKINKTIEAVIILIIVSFVLGTYLYDKLPETVASHWNTAGEVDGYMPRFWGAFLMPIVMTGMLILFIVFPKIDPLKRNIKGFQGYYYGFILAITIFMAYINILTLTWNLGYTIDIGRFMLPALGALFFYAGILITHSKRNWFIGIRTPWTLSSDYVWDKTHKIGGKVFRIGGIIIALTSFFPKMVWTVFFIVIIVMVLYPITASYFIYKKHKSKP